MQFRVGLQISHMFSATLFFWLSPSLSRDLLWEARWSAERVCIHYVEHQSCVLLSSLIA